ncbi:MAG: hypothetical protein MK136_17995 [Pirellulaceae bacterium]|nr:hypothetical protein [Pirellulaceae bacterium]
MAKKKANKRPRRPERSRRKGRTMAKKDANKKTARDGADQVPFFTAPIIWFNYPESSRCKIPRRQTKTVVYYGVMGLFVGFILACAAFTPSIVHDDLFKGPGVLLLIWPAGLLALAALFVWKSLLALRARIELVIDAKRLCVITRLGPFWRTRRCALSQLARFQIEDMRGLLNLQADRTSNDVFYDKTDDEELDETLEDDKDCVDDPRKESHWNLLAVQEDGRKLKILHCYPKEIVSQLCQDLPDQLRRFLPDSKQTNVAKFSRPAPTVEIHGVGPFDIRDRRQLPLNSDFRVEEHGEEQRVFLPRLGFYKTTNLLGKIVLPLILSMELLIMTWGFSEWFAGNVRGENATALGGIWCMITGVVIWQALIRTQAATCHGSISVTNHQLILRQRDLYGEHLGEWNLTAVESVDVQGSNFEDRFGKIRDLYAYTLYVTPSSSKRHSWFRNRPKEQLEWIRTWIHDQLPADAEKPGSPRKSV